jgi:DNA-binding cell septation regulator SpoVG
MQIKDFKIIEGPHAIKAVFSVNFGDITIKEFKVVQNEGQSAWVGMPTRDYIDDSEKKMYTQIVQITDPRLKGELTRLALQRYEKSRADKKPEAASYKGYSGLSTDWKQWPEHMQEKLQRRASDIHHIRTATKGYSSYPDALREAIREIRASV